MAQAELAFGRFRLQPGRQLFLGNDPIPLGAKPLNILTALVAAQGDLVTKDELIERVWPGMVVEENAIQAHISAIRKLLGEEARMIATVPGRGYRFAGAVEVRAGEMPKLEPLPVRDPTPPPPPVQKKAARRRPIVPFAFGLVVLVLIAAAAVWRFLDLGASAGADRYLVLPFVNHTGDTRFDSMAAMMADGVGSRLKTQAWEAEIVDRSEVATGKERPVVTPEQAKKLGLDYILDASLLYSDGALQASATVIDAGTGTQIAAVTTHAGQHDDAEQRQLLITGLVDQVRYVIAREQRRKAMAGKPDDNDIRNLLIRAQAGLDESGSPENWRSAAALIDKAMKLDPHNVHTLTVAGEARIHYVDAYSYKDELERTAMLNQADTYLSQAVTIEPTRAVIHLMMGDLRSAQGQHDAARAEYKRVLDLDALNAEAMDGLAMEDIFQGFPGAAIPKLDLALATNPEDAYLIYGDKAVLEMSLGRDAEALAAARQAVTVDSTDPWAWFTLAGLLQISGQTDEARTALDKLRRINPDITIARLRMADVNISPLFKKSEERLFAALKDAGMAESGPGPANASDAAVFRPN
ncbi:MAG TPA: winged helix-turn-helix domain-containing protein [Alphaproteobacteria bacterium]|jgi:DNA-binding winged helix-turn-helix (wHTH) protein/tetratricopeptide (TPR) repeat protein|nr:winged helix-turn-helix domain-containing protein [Alphaproteobacteria bacterium]